MRGGGATLENHDPSRMPDRTPGALTPLIRQASPGTFSLKGRRESYAPITSANAASNLS